MRADQKTSVLFDSSRVERQINPRSRSIKQRDCQHSAHSDKRQTAHLSPLMDGCPDTNHQVWLWLKYTYAVRKSVRRLMPLSLNCMAVSKMLTSRGFSKWFQLMWMLQVEYWVTCAIHLDNILLQGN